MVKPLEWSCLTMIANPANCPATLAPFAALALGADRVRARVTVPQQLTNDQVPQADVMARRPPDVLRLPPDTRGGGPRGPHPGDVLFWVACVGGACLLLMAAIS
jgi:hypothetical protein